MLKSAYDRTTDLVFNIGQNVLGVPGAFSTPGNYNIRLWFVDQSTSPLRSSTRGTALALALQNLLEKHFPSQGMLRNYVLQHGSDAELSPAVPFENDALREAAEVLKPLVIELLQAHGCVYDPQLLPLHKRAKTGADDSCLPGVAQLANAGYRQFSGSPRAVTDDFKEQLAVYGLTLAIANCGDDLFYKVIPRTERVATPVTVQEMITRKLAEQPELPCRVDEMTAREHALFEQLAALTGFLDYLSRQA